MNVLIRVDAGPKVGIGHFIRSFALAEGLKKEGHTVFFFGRFPKHLIALLKNKKIKAIILPKFRDLISEARYIKNLAQKFGVYWIVLDGYSFNLSYQKELKQNDSFGLLCIDDTAHTRYEVNLLLNQNTSADRKMYRGKFIGSVKLLLGPKYALLRKTFTKTKKRTSRYGIVRKILVTVGGGNFQPELIKVLKVIDSIQGCFEIHVLTSQMTQFNFKSKFKKRVLIHKNPKAYQIQKLMTRADLAVSSAGSTAWELCCLGVPSVLFVLSKNQVGVATSLGQAGVVVNLGWMKSLKPTKMKKVLTHLISNAKAREKMSRQGMKLVDGLGVKRVIEEMGLREGDK